MPDAHTAAVEAMAGALRGSSRLHHRPSCACQPWNAASECSCGSADVLARTALAALTTSVAARAALVETLHEAHHSHDLDCLRHRNVACVVRNDAERDADAILAALAPEEAG